MELKKNKRADVGRNSSLYFAIGLNVMLFLTLMALESKTYDRVEENIALVSFDKELEEDIPITTINTPPPPPPPPAVVEVIQIVEDVEEIEETVIESTETTQDEKIIPIIAVDDVDVEEIEEDVSVPFSVVEHVPIYPGCKGNREQLIQCFNKKILEHVQKNFKYPEMAKELGVHGKVFVLFAIDSNGYVSNIRTRGPDKSLEKEAERIIGLLPKMIPGKQRGKAVKVPYSIPIRFAIGY